MEWLVERIKSYGVTETDHDLWFNKDEYNRCLLKNVNDRLDKLRSGLLLPQDYVIKGSIELIQALVELINLKGFVF